MDSDCADGYNCDAGTCVTNGGAGDPCIVDGDCDAGYHCDEATGLCATDGLGGDDCTVDSDCTGGFHCEGELCTSDGGPGDPCTQDNECLDGYHCDEEAVECAADGGAGDACGVDSDCADGYHCDAELCVSDGGPGDPCLLDSECLDGYHCDEVAAECAADVGLDAACVEHTDCLEGLWCIDDVCDDQAPEGAPCTADGECADGLHCDDLCAADFVDGETCDEDSDCTSGHCGGTVCCLAGDCCVIDDECPAPVDPPTCDTPATCQGTSHESQCIEFVCTDVEVDDDSACAIDTVAAECDPYADLTCTGETDQAPPGDCPTGCLVPDDCVDGNACSPQGLCDPIICTLSGNQNDVVGCPLNLVRGAAAFPPAVLFQLILDFDHTLVTVDSFLACADLQPPFNLPCTPDGGQCDGLGAGVFCNPSTLVCSQCTTTAPDDLAAQLPTGHAIKSCAQPEPVPNCVDGQFNLLFWGGQSLPITLAYLENGAVMGISEFISIRFSLNTDVPEGTHVSINPVDFKAPDALARELPLEVRHSTAPNPLHYVLTGSP